MKRAIKMLTALALFFIFASALLCGCKSTKSSEHVHVYNDIYDATCNLCGYTRVPAPRPSEDPDDNPDPDENPDNPCNEPDPGENPDDPTDEPGSGENPDGGFVIDADTDGLIIAGLEDEYTLDEQTPSFDFTEVELEVYLSVAGEKSIAVPIENYDIAVTCGGQQSSDLKKLTADGTYTVTVTLKDFGYENGAAADESISFQTFFKIVNPVTDIRLLSGATTQYASKTDKISGSWTFGGIRANGGNFDIPAGEVAISPLITDIEGMHVAVVEYAGVTAQIGYTILALPQVIERVEVDYDNSEKIIDEGETFSVAVGDFTVIVSADGGYEYTDKYVLVYGEAESGRFDLPASDEPYSVKLRAIFNFTVEGENITKVFEYEARIKVTARVTEPENPNLNVDGEVIGALEGAITASCVLAESAGGAIAVIPSENVNITAVGCGEIEIGGRTFTTALAIAGREDSFQTCKDIKFMLNEPAVIKIYFSADEFAMVNIEGADGGVYDSDEYYPGNGSAALTFNLGQGEYSLSVLGNVNIYCIEAVFV